MQTFGTETVYNPLAPHSRTCAIRADDQAVVWISSNWSGRRASAGRSRMPARERADRRRLALSLPGRRRRASPCSSADDAPTPTSAADRRAGDRLRAGVRAASFEFGNGLRAARRSSCSSRCCSSRRCRSCRCWWRSATVIAPLPGLHRAAHGTATAGSHCFGDSWFAVGPVLVLGRARARRPRSSITSASTPLALVAQLAVRLRLGADRATLARRRHAVERAICGAVWRYWIDAILTPVALHHRRRGRRRAARAARASPRWSGCSRSSRASAGALRRRARAAPAYRGTVMLLADVVEADDDYTADHCRSVVELAPRRRRRRWSSTGDDAAGARVRRAAARRRQDRDPQGDPQQAGARSPTSEFELMKTHTIEGQVLLDRVGGLLGRVGEIVRSCHERWDGRGYPDGLHGRGDPARGPHRVRLRRLQRDDHEPPLPRAR